MFGGYSDPLPGYSLGGLQVAFQAQEALRRQLASELGLHGVRVVTLQTGGVPATIPEGVDGREAIVDDIERSTMLAEPPRSTTSATWRCSSPPTGLAP